MAVEVELTGKATARLRAILAGYRHQIQTGALERIVYVCDDPLVARGAARAAARTGLGPEELRQVELSEVIADVRLEAAERRTPMRARLRRGWRHTEPSSSGPDRQCPCPAFPAPHHAPTLSRFDVDANPPSREAVRGVARSGARPDGQAATRFRLGPVCTCDPGMSGRVVE